METAHMLDAETKKSTKQKSSSKSGQDATMLLRADHKLVSGLFEE